MSGALHRLVYRSVFSVPGSADQTREQIAHIMASARRRNAAAGLNGALLHSGETILQVLEGPLEPLEAAYDRISADLRHTGLVLLQFVPIAKRAFPDWRMAYLPQSALEPFWPDLGRGVALTPDDLPRMIEALTAALPALEQAAA